MKQTRIDDENTNELYTVLPNVKKGVPDDRKANIELYNEDNMTLMARYPDNYFDLAIVDPPYGIGAGSNNFKNGTSNNKTIDFRETDWDNEIPNKEYFDELFRVSKNQIIWGGNYMTEYLPPKSCWLFWDKGTGDNSYADGELAWTSFDGAMRKITKSWVGANAKNGTKRIHPTEKPIYLYGWIINKYCKEGFKVLDTHLGSGSIALACDMYKVDLVACEIDEKYFNNAKKRLEVEQSQQSLF